MTDNNGEEEKEEMDFHMERITGDIRMHKYMFRICLIGGQCVGKTSLLATYTENAYKEKYSPTVGIDFRVITLKYKDIIAKVHIWDTAGQERFKSIAINYFRSTHGFIFVYDITDENSFSNIENWINLAFNNSTSHLINFLVGNKTDLEDERQIKKKDAEEFAKSRDLFFLETSAKNNDNVEKLFEYFTYKLIRYFKKNNMASKDTEGTKLTGNFEQIQSNEKEKKKCSC